MLRSGLLATLGLVLVLAGRAAAGAPSRALACAPSRSGSVTTWLVAGPMKFLRPEGLDRDFLKATGGEAAARPREGDVADPVSGVAWRACVFPRDVLNLKQRCLATGESAFYFYATLLPREDFHVTLELTHTGWARLWVDGKRTLQSDYDPLTGYRSVARRLKLQAGRPVPCLLKVGSKLRQLQVIVALRRDGRPVGPKDLTIALPHPAEAPPLVPSHVFSALSLGLGRERFVQPGRPCHAVFGVQGGYPLCEGTVSARVTARNAAGLPVATLETEPATVAALAEAPARLTWTAPPEGATASYELSARVAYEGEELGALSKTVYAPSELSRWTQALAERLQKVQEARHPDRDAFAHVLLKIEKATRLWQGATVGSFAADEVHRELKVASQWLDRLEAGKPLPPPVEPGVHEHAYLATQDDSAQPYYLHVPRTYDPARPAPAIVYLHGYAPDLDKTNWHLPSPALTDQAEARGYVLIVPFARSNTDFQGVGEVDVLHVLDLARQRLRLDPDRLFLVGYSMGGMGAYTIAAHHPHVWAGVVALCARADYYFWKGLDREKVEPWKRHLLDAEFGWPLATNFLHVPVLAFQGTADTLIKPEQASRFVDRLTRLGAQARLVPLEGSDHWIADEAFSAPTAFEWMDRQRRDPAPRTIRFTTYSLRYPRAYWATVDAFAREAAPARIDLTLERPDRLTLVTDNVARLTLRPPRELVAPGTPLRATVDGKLSTLRPDRRGRYVLTLAPVPDGPLRKRPGLCGPIKDAFHRRFLLVYGTRGGEEATQANRQAATRFRRDWARFAKGAPDVLADTELTDKQIAGANLVLFGTPATHATLAAIAPKLPIQFTDQGYRLLDHTYAANAHTGVMLLYPNPLAPDRTVVVCSGAPYGEALPVNHKYDLLPDFIVYSSQTDYDDTNAPYCAGFFDSAWELDKSLLWTSDGQPRPRPALAAPPEPLPVAPEAPARP